MNIIRIRQIGPEKYNFERTDGSLLCEKWFDWAEEFREGFAVVQREDGLFNFLKTDGTFLSAEWFDWIELFREGFAVVQRVRG